MFRCSFIFSQFAAMASAGSTVPHTRTVSRSAPPQCSLRSSATRSGCTASRSRSLLTASVRDLPSVSSFVLIEAVSYLVGLGPSGSNAGEVSGSNTTPTFVENLVSEGTIDEPVFGIYVGPLSDDVGSAGEITFGGVDESRISGTYYIRSAGAERMLKRLRKATWSGSRRRRPCTGHSTCVPSSFSLRTS